MNLFLLEGVIIYLRGFRLLMSVLRFHIKSAICQLLLLIFLVGSRFTALIRNHIGSWSGTCFLNLLSSPRCLIICDYDPFLLPRRLIIMSCDNLYAALTVVDMWHAWLLTGYATVIFFNSIIFVAFLWVFIINLVALIFCQRLIL